VKASIPTAADPENELGVPAVVESQNATVGSDEAAKDAMGVWRTTGEIGHADHADDVALTDRSAITVSVVPGHRVAV
jgi:hypothetical protein